MFDQQQLCNRFNCTPEQLRGLHAMNAEGLRWMAKKAAGTRRKVNGYTAEQLDKMATQTEALARGEAVTA